MLKQLSIFCAAAFSIHANAASFNFADIANGDSSYGAADGEYGATTIDFYSDGIGLTAGGTDVNTGAVYNAYLDSSWNHSDGGGDGGLGVCKVLSSGAQCNPGSDDNVTLNESLNLVFDQQVTISQITFRNGEHNPWFADDAAFDLVIDRGLTSELALNYSLAHIFDIPLLGTTFDFMNTNSTDSDEYRFYISAMEVQPVPVPAAVWLFGSGLLGMVGVMRRKR